MDKGELGGEGEGVEALSLERERVARKREGVKAGTLDMGELGGWGEGVGAVRFDKV